MQGQKYLTTCNDLSKKSNDNVLEYLRGPLGRKHAVHDIVLSYEKLEDIRKFCRQLQEDPKMKSVDPKIKELIEELLVNLNRKTPNDREGASSARASATRPASSGAADRASMHDISSDAEAAEPVSSGGWYDEPTPKDLCGHSVSRETCRGPTCEWKEERCQSQGKGAKVEPSASRSSRSSARKTPNDRGGASPARASATRPVSSGAAGRTTMHDISSGAEAAVSVSSGGWYDEPTPKDLCGHSVSRETCRGPTCEWKEKRCQVQGKGAKVEPGASRRRPRGLFGRVTSAVVAAAALAGNIIPSRQPGSLVPPGYFAEHPLQPRPLRPELVGLPRNDTWLPGTRTLTVV